jgi:hypothetical protein
MKTVVACGALAIDVRRIARRRGWDVKVIPVPALLHNHPERIGGAVDALCHEHDVVAVAYGDCGTRGALDGLPRLDGENCYDVFAGPEVRDALEEEPGTYFLTDFLARTFEHTVWRELGLDRYPELRDEYFRHYTRVMWLVQRPVPATRMAATRAAERLGLPLVVREVGNAGLERELERVMLTDRAGSRPQRAEHGHPGQHRAHAERALAAEPLPEREVGAER